MHGCTWQHSALIRKQMLLRHAVLTHASIYTLLSALHVTSVQLHAFIFTPELYQLSDESFLLNVKGVCHMSCVLKALNVTQACVQQDVAVFVQTEKLDDDKDDNNEYDEYDAEAEAMSAVGPADVAAINKAEDENDSASLSAAAINPGNGSHHLLACDVKSPGTQALLLPCKRAFTELQSITAC